MGTIFGIISQSGGVPGWGWAAFEKKGVFLTLFHTERNQRSSFLSNAAPFTAWPILMNVGAPKAASLCCIVHLEDELKMSPRSHVFKTMGTFCANCFVLVYLKLDSGTLCRPNLSEANYSTNILANILTTESWKSFERLITTRGKLVFLCKLEMNGKPKNLDRYGLNSNKYLLCGFVPVCTIPEYKESPWMYLSLFFLRKFRRWQ